jgi:HEPN domain-containing protein
MDADKTVVYWVRTAKKDYRVMRHLFANKDYAHSLFFGHLTLEKLLKAYYCKNRKAHAPYKHNLLLLAEEAGLKLSGERRELLEAVNRFNIEARYPDLKFEFYKMCTQSFTKGYVRRIREMYKWLSEKISKH